MSTTRTVLTDALLKDALSTRAVGQDVSADLLDDVLLAVQATTQSRGWGIQLPRLGRPLVVFVAAALVLSGLVALALLAGGRNPTPAPGAGEIAFVNATYTCGDSPCVLTARITGLRAEEPRILGISSDGGEPTPLVDVPGATDRPTGWSLADPRSNWLAGPAVRWSSDGTKLAFRLFNDAPGIYLVNRDGSGLTRLVDLPHDAGTGMGSAGLAWSADGRRIAYTYPFGGLRSPLYVVDTADGRVTDLQTLATRSIAWSPDGSRIAFARTEGSIGTGGTHTGLVVTNADGTGETRLANPDAPYHVISLAWSADGSRIAFGLVGDSRAQGPDRQGLYAINPDGTGLLRLSELHPGDVDVHGGCCIHVGGGGSLAWSPDGRRVAAIEPVYDGNTGIVVANADGSGVRRFGPISAYDLAWSPDGARLVYAAGPDWTAGWDVSREITTEPWSAIYVINADGTGLRWLAHGEYPDWSPEVGP